MIQHQKSVITNKLIQYYCRIHYQHTNSVMFLYTNNEKSEREFKIQLHFSHLKYKKYLGMNLTNKVKDLYTEYYKTLMKEAKGHPDEYKNIWVHELRDSILPKI